MHCAAARHAMRKSDGEYDSLWRGVGSRECKSKMLECGLGPPVVISPRGVLMV